MSCGQTEQFVLGESLSGDQQERLAQILEDYLAKMEQGACPNADELLAKYPDLAVPLKAYLESLNYLHRAATNLESSPGDAVLPTDETDMQLGDFTILREIGRGGMGIVYEAQQMSLDRRVALKVLPYAALLDKKRIARFQNESRAAAQLHHPNIVPVFLVGCERGVHYYAMQHIEGQSLDQVVQELRESTGLGVLEGAPTKITSGTVRQHVGEVAGSTRRLLSTTESFESRDYVRAVAELGSQAAEALQHAHDYGVVHRDIKPSNLLLDDQGKLWITDFGLAMFQTDSDLTITGDVVGTLRYMSPEQAAGNSVLVDQRTDVYSLGITLYELLTLRPAFDHEDRQAFLRAIASEEPRALRRVRPAIPVDLETIVQKAISKSPDQRYTTARQMADDLQRFLEGKPILARPPTLSDRVGKWTKRHQKAVRVALGFAAVLLVGLATSTLLIAREQAKTRNALSESKAHFEEAQESLEEALNVVDHFALHYPQQLRKVPGAERLSRQMAAEALAYYERFAQRVGDTPDLQNRVQYRVALTHFNVGRLSELIDDKEKALAAYQQAEALLQGLSKAAPKDKQYRERLAVCNNNAGLLCSKLHRTAEAEAAYQKAIGIQKGLIKDDPRSAEYRSGLALFYGNLGLLLAEANRPQPAGAMHDAAVEIQTQLLENHPEESKYLGDLAVSYNNLSLLYADDDPQEAERFCRKALEIEEKLVESAPEEIRYQGDLALFLNNLGALQRRLEQPDQALESYQRAAGIQEKLVRKAPETIQYRCDLAITYNNLGQVLSGLPDGDPEKALQSFEQARAILEDLVDDYPNDLNHHSTLGGILNNQGMVYEQLDQLDKAADVYARAIQQQRIAHDGAPNVEDFREFLSKHYYNYGQVLRARKQFEEAAEVALARKQLWPGDPQRLFSVASELAKTVNEVIIEGGDQAPEAASTRRRLADLAIAALQEAIDAGFDRPEAITGSSDLQAVRDHPQFAGLLEALTGRHGQASPEEVPSHSER